jgi:hypothetical protein
MNLFYYCFYRIANSKFYKVLDANYGYIYAWGIISLCQAWNILTLLSIPYMYIRKMYDIKVVGCTMILVGIINLIFFLTEKKYYQLKERWKDEDKKQKAVRGWLIALYVVSSAIMFFVGLDCMKTHL